MNDENQMYFCTQSSLPESWLLNIISIHTHITNTALMEADLTGAQPHCGGVDTSLTAWQYFLAAE